MEKVNVEARLADLGLQLPTPAGSKGIYKSCLTIDTIVFVSGHVSIETNGALIRGKLGADMSDDDGKLAARQSALAMLASLKKHLGDLDRIKRVVKLLGMVNATSDFDRHPIIINGCSELFAAIWGDDNGVGVRSAVGMGSLPGNVAVEIEGLFEIYK